MANSSNFIMASTHIKFQLSEFLIAILLKGSEFKQDFFIALAFLTKVTLKFGDSSLLFIFSFSKEVYLSFVDILQVFFSQLHFFSLSVLQLLDLRCILSFKLTLNIIVGSENTLHILFCLLLGIK